jgi:hypothetical protein
MQRILPVFLLWCFLSCQQSAKQPLAKLPKDTVQPAKQLVSENESAAAAARTTYDSTIYQSYIDPGLKTYLEKEHPGWKWLAPNRWDTAWFNSYKTDSTLVSYVASDFNCDHRRDYAAILKDNTGAIGAYAFLATGSHSFRTVALEGFGKDEGKLVEVGLEVLPEGEVDYVDPNDGDEPLSVKVKCKSIQVLYFEKAATTYYWDKGQLKSVVTGD